LLLLPLRPASVAVSFFFFQAEDGIRDFHVTGVQTCALPILHLFRIGPEVLDDPRLLELAHREDRRGAPLHLLELPASSGATFRRSEERRVGRGCACWAWPPPATSSPPSSATPAPHSRPHPPP